LFVTYNASENKTRVNLLSRSHSVSPFLSLSLSLSVFINTRGCHERSNTVPFSRRFLRVHKAKEGMTTGKFVWSGRAAVRFSDKFETIGRASCHSSRRQRPGGVINYNIVKTTIAIVEQNVSPRGRCRLPLCGPAKLKHTLYLR